MSFGRFCLPKARVAGLCFSVVLSAAVSWSASCAAAETDASASAADPREKMPAKQLFGRQRFAAPLRPRAIGFYNGGCLAGAEPLEVDGPAWQAMRLSRNRNWGHPLLVETVRQLAKDARKYDGWPGLLVGDLAQPRGGPMLTGHASHQIGLDADIWFTPMPNRRLSQREREDLSATSMLASTTTVDPKIWSLNHVRLIRRAASYEPVERILVHPAIKKALCEGAKELGGDDKWLAKVRPYWGHHYHFHVRIGCPPGSTGCRSQDPPTGDTGCTSELDYWYRLLTDPPKPSGPEVKRKPRPPLTLARLPAECRQVLDAAAIVAPAPVPAKRPQ
ncbi:MAG: penicillin-insensitive murein endopeptidase [Alphaproteobacteria bacterium]|nr:penicillin-insensitive murein endopeptidase [Alphaproteobacteria bacterium]